MLWGLPDYAWMDWGCTGLEINIAAVTSESRVARAGRDKGCVNVVGNLSACQPRCYAEYREHSASSLISWNVLLPRFPLVY